MIIWDAVSGLKLQAIPLESPWVLLCAFAPSGRFVALAGLDNRCTIYKVETANDYHIRTRSNAMELRENGRKIPRLTPLMFLHVNSLPMTKSLLLPVT